MKKIAKKLRSQTGESIAETLIAVLVIAVALTMLAAMITATANMVKKSEKKMDEYYTANAALETLSGGNSSNSISINISTNSSEGGSSSIESVSAVYVENRVLSKPVIAYRLQTSGGGGE